MRPVAQLNTGAVIFIVNIKYLILIKFLITLIN